MIRQFIIPVRGTGEFEDVKSLLESMNLEYYVSVIIAEISEEKLNSIVGRKLTNEEIDKIQSQWLFSEDFEYGIEQWLTDVLDEIFEEKEV